MSTATKAAQSQWILLTLLVVSIFVNYIDRSNLSIAAPVIQDELSLTPAQIGSLLSAFFWTYALVQLFGIAGWLADRFPAGIVLAGGYLLWSVATIVTGFVSGLPALFLARLALGAGESVAYPCYSRILATEVPPERRGLPNALIDAGSKLGPALGSFIGASLVLLVGWRIFFIALGAASLIWLIPWWFAMPQSDVHVSQTKSGPTVAQIVVQRSAWGAFIGHFCGNYFWYFLLTWLPTYLVKERGVSFAEMGRINTFSFLAIATATVCSGWLSDRLITGGASATRVRKTILVLGLGCCTSIMPVAAIHDKNLSIALLFVSCISFGIYASNHWATTQTLAGPLAAGRWTSLQNGVGNLSGIAASWLTGVVVEQTGQFHLAFVVAAVVALTGAVMWGFVVGPVKEVDWRR